MTASFYKNMYVYIMTNDFHTVFYIGVTNNIERRVWEHKTKRNPKSFTAQYKITKLVYYEYFDGPLAAIAREKQLKRWHRGWKIDMIKRENPEMKDLSVGWYEGSTRRMV